MLTNVFKEFVSPLLIWNFLTVYISLQIFERNVAKFSPTDTCIPSTEQAMQFEVPQEKSEL